MATCFTEKCPVCGGLHESSNVGNDSLMGVKFIMCPNVPETSALLVSGKAMVLMNNIGGYNADSRG
jgi:hypothetical protein